MKRLTIEEMLKDRTLNLPVLENNTKKVVEFNSSFSEEIKDNQKRNFWDLLKIK